MMEEPEPGLNAGIHENLRCPKCQSEWWKGTFAIDKEDDEVAGYENLIECARCGHVDGVLQLTNRSLPQGEV